MSEGFVVDRMFLIEQSGRSSFSAGSIRSEATAPLRSTSISRIPMAKGLTTLLSTTLGLKPGERLAFIHDREFASLAQPIIDYCKDNGVSCEAVTVDHDGIRPLPTSVKEIILDPKVGVILFGTVHNIWHIPERKQAKYQLGKRLASIVCGPNHLDQNAPASNIGEIARVCRELSQLFVPGAAVTITSPAGCDFSAVIGMPFCEHGEYHESGNGGDYPAGETGFGPRERSVNGRIVYDVKVQHLGVLKSPLVLNVEYDKIIGISGPYRDAFENLCARRGDILKFISEISIGLNPFVGITSEPQFIPEEKTYGTAHCGHGGNGSYGTREGPHIDGVISSPTVTINGVVVMDNGRLCEGVLKTLLPDWANKI